MATKKGGKCNRSYFRAHLVTNVGTCAFCHRAVDDEIIYGKLYAIGDIQCHYFCALLSCCLVQKGSDQEGLFGFLYPDILAEVERSKKHKCSYCNREGANLGCSVSQCRKQFHLPCGRERNAVSLFYGNFKSYCENHAPKQKLTDSVATRVKIRIAEERRQKQSKTQKTVSKPVCDSETQSADTVCVICYEAVQGFPGTQTFWPPCCARDAWLHRACLQRMALSAGMHYLKCPLCNDKENFYQAVISQGYYLPDRDAAWELEQNAFAEIYERPLSCGADACKCPHGRDHDTDSGLWDIKLCILCGSTGIHAGCTDNGDENVKIYICHICQPAAPADLEKLIVSIESVQLQEQASETPSRGPIMPSRMSLRRTKGREAYYNRPSSSRISTQNQNETDIKDTKTTTESGRLDLNLRKPQRGTIEYTAKNTHNILFSPTKMLEQGLNERLAQLEKKASVDPSKVMEKLREKLRKPRPLVEKKRIVTNILEEIFNTLLKDPKAMEWNSPKKISNLSHDVTPQKNVNDKNEVSPTTFKKNFDGNTEVKNRNGLKNVDGGNRLTISLRGKEKEILAKEKSPCKNEIQNEENTSPKNRDCVQDLLMDWTSPEKIGDCEKSQDSSENSPLTRKSPINNSPTKRKSLLRYNRKNSSTKKVLNDDFKCIFKHKHIDRETPQSQLRTAIDFALEAYKSERTIKRQASPQNDSRKRRKIDKDSSEINLKRKASPQDERDRKKREIDKDNSVIVESDKETELCGTEELKEVNSSKRYSSLKRKLITIDSEDKSSVDKEILLDGVEELKDGSDTTEIFTKDAKLREEINAVRNEKNISLTLDTDSVHKENLLDKDVKSVRNFTKEANVREKNAVKIKGKNLRINKGKASRKVTKTLRRKSVKKGKVNLSLKRKTRIGQIRTEIASETVVIDSDVEIVDSIDKGANVELNTQNDLKETEIVNIDDNVINTRKVNIMKDPEVIDVNEIKKEEFKPDIKRFDVKNDLKQEKENRKKKERVKIKTNSKPDKVINLTLDKQDLKSKHKKQHKKMLSIRNKDIKVKIRWKEKELKLKITEKKRRYVKAEKTGTDAASLVQTSISSFFKPIPKQSSSLDVLKRIREETDC